MTFREHIKMQMLQKSNEDVLLSHRGKKRQRHFKFQSASFVLSSSAISNFVTLGLSKHFGDPYLPLLTSRFSSRFSLGEGWFQNVRGCVWWPSGRRGFPLAAAASRPGEADFLSQEPPVSWGTALLARFHGVTMPRSMRA